MSVWVCGETLVDVLKDGDSYLFTIDGTATFDFNDQWLPDPSRTRPNVLHIGSLATIVEPGANALYEWAMKVGEFAPVVFDPNVRTSYLLDCAAQAAAITCSRAGAQPPTKSELKTKEKNRA